MDPEGNAVAVWRQSDGTRFNIWSNRYTLGANWGTAVLIETEDDGDAEGPQVAMDATGHATAVWHQSDGMRENIWSNRYTASGAWGAAEEIEDNTGNATEPQVAVDPGGNAVVVWQQSDGMRENIWSNRYTPSEGWSTQQPIETNNAGPARFPQVAVDASGNAVAVWQQSDGMRENIWFNSYTPTGGWGVAGLIEADDGDATAPQVAMDPAGNVVAVWQQSDGSRENIWSNRYAVGDSWGTVERVDSRAQGSARNPQVAMDARGIAVAVWTQTDGGRDSIWSNRYIPGSRWGTAERIVADDAGRARQPQVAADPEGNAVAVWLQSEGTTDTIWSNRLE
jgi:predicted enzyme related to lactoylglutathione lyase